jgi:hypothetical protein
VLKIPLNSNLFCVCVWWWGGGHPFFLQQDKIIQRGVITLKSRKWKDARSMIQLFGTIIAMTDVCFSFLIPVSPFPSDYALLDPIGHRGDDDRQLFVGSGPHTPRDRARTPTRMSAYRNCIVGEGELGPESTFNRPRRSKSCPRRVRGEQINVFSEYTLRSSTRALHICKNSHAHQQSGGRCMMKDLACRKKTSVL